MRLPKLAIDNYQFTIMIFMLLILTGVVSFLTMPRSEDPAVNIPGSNVIVIYPGATPTDLEELVLDPIETALNELEDIRKITSRANDGIAVVGIEFEVGSDADDKYSDVIQKVNSIREKLPDDLYSLRIARWSASDVNILQAALISDDAEYYELESEAERLKKSIEKIPGIQKAETWAYPDREVRISLNMAKMAKNNIPVNMVMGAIADLNANIPGGSVDIGNKKFNITTSGSYESLEEIKKTIVSASGANVVYLSDIADINMGYGDESYRGRYNGKRCVFVTAQQKQGTNIYFVSDEVKEAAAKFEEGLPGSIKMNIFFDQSESVRNRVNIFFSNLLQGLVLVGIVILIALGWRGAIIVILAIPISIMIGIGAVDFSGFGLQQITIAALVIALGLLVDNAIVISENISRFLKMGYSRKEAAIKGTQQIAWAVVSSTVTTVLAFIPIMMIQDKTGDFIRGLPVTVVWTLMASLLVSLTLTPFLNSKLIKKRKELQGDDTSNGVYKANRLRQMMDRFIENYYKRALSFALRHTLLTILISLAVFMGSLSLFPLIGFSFFPKAEKPQFIINIFTPEGSSLDYTDKTANYVEDILNTRKEIRHYAVNVGHGNPRVYYNVWPKENAPNHAQIFVELKKEYIKKIPDIIDSLRKDFEDYPGAEIELKELEQGPPIGAPVQIRIIGDNLKLLKKIAFDVEEMFDNTAGTINVSNPLATATTELHVNINKAKAAMLGVPVSDIDKTVRASISGLAVSKYRDPEGEEHDIVVRLPIDEKPSVSDFEKIYIMSRSGAQVSLKQLANIEFKPTPMAVNHFNLDRNVIISSDVESGASVDAVTKEIIEKLEEYNWLPGYRYYVAGELESRNESFGGMAKAVMIAIIAILAVLVLQFRSFTQPLIVFAAIPLALIGSLLGLFLTGNSFSFTAFVGITSLVGIVINNSIILVDYANQVRRSGMELFEALIQAGTTRFMPILLTTLTTIGGLLPLTLGGGSMWAPMGWTIIGGLLVSTILTLLVVPVLYKLLSGKTV